MLFYTYRIKIRRNKMTCKQCIYFKKFSKEMLEKIEPDKPNGICYVDKPEVIAFNGRLTNIRPEVHSDDVTCEKFVELGVISAEKAYVDPKDN